MDVRIIVGDCRETIKTLPEKSVHCVVTSPPYFGLRNYNVDGQIGLEETPQQFVDELVGVFRDVRRVLRDDGTVWLNLGDSYAGSGNGMQGKNGQRADRRFTAERLPPKKGDGIKPKDLIGIPWRVAFALQSDGWYLRQDIIWAKPNCMPESVRDRCTKSHEYIFLLSKSDSYFFDQDAIREPLAASSIERVKHGWKSERANNGVDGAQGIDVEQMGNRFAPEGGRNKRSVWFVSPRPFKEAHFATYPPELIEPCIKAGCPAGGVVLDPFGGAGTTGLVADRLGRNAVLCELNPEYARMAHDRINGDGGMFGAAEVVA